MSSKEDSMQKLKKFAWSMMMRNKKRDIKNIYEIGYSFGLDDNDISNVMREINF